MAAGASVAAGVSAGEPIPIVGGTFGASTDIRLARDLPNDITFEPPPCIWLMMNSQNSRKITNGRM